MYKKSQGETLTQYLWILPLPCSSVLKHLVSQLNAGLKQRLEEWEEEIFQRQAYGQL